MTEADGRCRWRLVSTARNFPHEILAPCGALAPASWSDLRMSEQEQRPYASTSDEELLAMEQDRSLPIDAWTAVEAERGRRLPPWGSRRPLAESTSRF